MTNCAVILAGGQGTRMKSRRPKAMNEVLFKPMLDWVITAAKKADIDDICVVTGFASECIEAHLSDSVKTVHQQERLGTGHAAMQATDFIAEHKGGNVVILSGDVPFVDNETIIGAMNYHELRGNMVTVITAEVTNPFGYGRIVRDKNGDVEKIVEESSADDNVKRIKEVNSGAYCFNVDTLLEVLPKIAANNSKGEYYITDAVGIIIDEGGRAGAYNADDENIVLGANTRIQLSHLNEIARQKVMDNLMEEGVDIPCRDGIIIGPDCKIGMDSRILPNTIICGNSQIGEGCVIGPNSYVEDAVIGNDVRFNNGQIRNAKIQNGCDIGPFTQIRPNSEIGDGVHLGNFVEVKNSVIDTDTKVSHLTYVGDSDVGKNVNFGCGVVTVNYTGKSKHRTTIEDGAFIGCNTNLIAPVTVGKNSYTAAGSTITQNVPDNSLGIARERQTNKDGWVKKKQPYKKKVE